MPLTQSLRDRLVFATESGESTLPPECALLLLSSTLATPSTFVVNHFLHECLQTPSNHEKKEFLVFLSFLNGFENLSVGLKKLGVDLSQAKKQGRFVSLDGFSGLFHSSIKSTTKDSSFVISLESSTSWINQIATQIIKALESQDGKATLFVEGLDFLLAAGEGKISVNETLSLLSTLSERTSRMFIQLYADHNLLDSIPPTTLSTNQSVLLNSLIHRSHSIVSLRPLKTGTAKDVNGIMRITKGGAWYDFPRPQRSSENEEWEMLYRIEDGRVKLFKNA